MNDAVDVSGQTMEGYWLDAFGMVIDNDPFRYRTVSGPCITIPVTEAMRRQDALDRARREQPIHSPWTIKSALRPENLGRQGAVKRPAAVSRPKASLPEALPPIELSAADLDQARGPGYVMARILARRCERSYRLRKQAQAAARQQKA